MKNTAPETVPFWLDPKKRAIFFQFITLCVVGLLAYYLISNTIHNLKRQNIATGLRFLDKESSFEIGESLISYSAASSYGRALIVGALNTLYVSSIGVIITIILIAGFSWFFKRSTLGVSMRAVSDDQLASMSIGISIPRVFGLAWATAGFSAAAAGGIIGNITGLNFDTLRTFGIIVFPVVILGGLDSIFGAVVGGIIMGLIQQFAAGYLDGTWGLNGTADLLPYIVLLILLLFKPHGLFGIQEIERV